MDKIILSGMTFYGFHGMSAAEQELGQRFELDVVAELDLSAAGASDALEDTVSYTELYRMIREVMEGPSRRLIEHVAETIAQRVLSETKVQRVRVSVRKPKPPMKGSVLDYAAVEIVRGKPTDADASGSDG